MTNPIPEPRVLFLHLAQVSISPRIREDIGDEEEFEAFCKSIETFGQLQSIVVTDNHDGSYELENGERRWRAIAKLNAHGKEIPGLPVGKIRAEISGFLTKEVSMMKEYEENARRKNFTFQEEAKYVRTMHDQMKSKHGDNWTQEMTAQLLNIATGKISYLLNLHEAIEKNPEIAKATTLGSAVRRAKIARQNEVRRLEVRENKSEQIKKAEQMLVCADAREWIKTIPDSSIDLVNFDPPWGTDIATDDRGFGMTEEFDDSPEYATDVMQTLFPELFRVLKDDRFCILWAGIETISNILTMARSAGFDTKYRMHIPQIWYKPDKVSDFTAQRFPGKNVPTHSYETFYFLTKGEPSWQAASQDIYIEPRMQYQLKIHRTQKPVALMERILRNLIIPGEVVLDPCAGSFAVGVAAYLSSRKAIGCELDKAICERAITWLAETIK